MNKLRREKKEMKLLLLLLEGMGRFNQSEVSFSTSVNACEINLSRKEHH